MSEAMKSNQTTVEIQPVSSNKPQGQAAPNMPANNIEQNKSLDNGKTKIDDKNKKQSNTYKSMDKKLGKPETMDNNKQKGAPPVPENKGCWVIF